MDTGAQHNGTASEVGITVIALDHRKEPKYDAFHRISQEKQRRILDAALELFAEQDYGQVSTNEIVRKAGISKGLLFRYFGDKAGLFGYLLSDTTYHFIAETIGSFTLGSRDVFDLLLHIINVKMEVALRNALEVRFFVRALKSNLPAEAAVYVTDALRGTYDTLGFINEGLDERRLRDGLDRHTVAKIIEYFCRGYTDEVLENIDLNQDIEESYDRMVEETTMYFRLIKTLFYKEEGDAVP
jgi:AcrR family transcriptional regulator